MTNNSWSDHKTADLVLTGLQNIPHWKAKVPYVSSAKQANMSSVLPKLIQIHFVIANCV